MAYSTPFHGVPYARKFLTVRLEIAYPTAGKEVTIRLENGVQYDWKSQSVLFDIAWELLAVRLKLAYGSARIGIQYGWKMTFSTLERSLTVLLDGYSQC